MSGLFGGAQKAQTSPTKAMGIDFQGAQYGNVVPVVYGRNSVAANCVWYGDFKATAQQQKSGKGGGGGGTTNYTYSASLQLGLCEGPGISLVQVLNGTSIVNLSSINYTFASGAAGQAPWSHLSGSAALGYTLTSLFSVQNLALGSSPTIPNWNFIVNGLKPYGSGIVDANPKDILSDICSDANHGINFPWLGSLTQYSNYCVANSLFLSPVYNQQQSGNETLSDLFKYTNAYAYYSDDQLKVVPLGDVAVTGNGVTYTPNVTPVVNLGTNDFIVDGSGDAAITIDRKAPQDNLNLVRVEFNDSANYYNDSVVTASIDEDLIANGGRSDDSETVNGCTTAAVGRFIAQNLVQRAFYIRNTYQFKLSWRYCYLEPTDIVTLTDASIGLNLFPVRITDVEEDENSTLTITAEEFPEGIGHSAIYNTQPNGGTNIDQNSDPGAVNAPFLFRGPGFLVSNNTPEIWCAVNGSNAMWAGCEVYLSHDGTSYTYCGTVASQARYGALTTSLPAGSADPDTTNTPTVQLYQPAQLLGGSQTDADNFVTLAMVDTEIIAYETSTLVAASEYTLGYLRRGGYGSANVAHSSGAPFVRLDDSIFRIPVDPSLIGQTVYLKFLSLNCFGRTPRTLASETAYTYVVGTNVELPDVPDVPASFAVLPVADGVNLTWSNDNPAATGCTSIEYATASGGPWTVLAQVGPTTTSYHDAFTDGSTYYYRARARGPLPQSGWSAYTATLSSTGVNVTGTGGLSDTLTNTSNTLVNANFNGWGANGSLHGWTVDNGTWVHQSGTNGPLSGTSSYAYRTGSSGTPSDAIRNTANFPVYPGAMVKASCLVRGTGSPNGTCQVRISWRDATLSELSVTHGSAVTGNVTGTSSVSSAAPAGAVIARIEADAIGHTTGAYAVDNFTASSTADSMDQVPDGGSRYASINDATTQAQQAAQIAASYLPGQNILPNPAFTLGIAGQLPFGWAQSGSGWQCNAPGLGGPFYTFAVLAVSSSTPTTNTLFSTQVPVLPNSAVSIQLQYSIGGASALSSGDFSADIQWRDSSKALISSSARIFIASANTGSGAVVAQLTNITSPSNAAYADIRIYSENAAETAGIVYFRCSRIKLEMGSACTPFSDDATNYGNLLTVPASGQQIGDQSNLPPVNTSGGGAILTSSPLSFSISGTTITFNCAAVGVNYGSFTTNYNAATSINKTQSAGTTQTWYLYYVDPTYAGGTQTLNASTSVASLVASNGVVNLGSCTVTVASGGGGSGGTGGGGGRCVADDMFIGEGRTAGDAEIGDPFDCIDMPTSAGKHVRALQGVSRGIEECVRMITSDGCALVCSISTPFDLPDGRSTTATHMLGEQVITDLGATTVISLALVGPRPVTRAHLGGVSYAAGADPQRRIYSHNFSGKP